MGKLALVTGGSSGIGLALSKQLARLGANVWILARREDQLKLALNEIQKEKANPSQQFGYLVVDVSDRAQIETSLNTFLKDAWIPDLLVNNAGISRPGLFLEQDPDIFQQMIQINYLGAVYVTKVIAPQMAARRSGHIVNISSIAGFAGVYGYSAYGASKYALRGLTDTLRVELKPYNVKVSVVFPADTKTPQLEGDEPYLPPLTRQLSSDNGGLLTPEKVSDTIIKGVMNEQYIITPGFNSAFLYHANNIMDNLSYWVMDQMIADAQRKLDRKTAQAK